MPRRPRAAVASAVVRRGRTPVHVVVDRLRPGGQRAGRRARARRPHGRRSSTRTDAPSGGCPPTSRPHDRRLRLRPRPPRRGRDRRGRGVRVRDERRQLQHPVRPDRTRDVRHRARRRPHLRPAPRARSTNGSASPRSRPSRGRPTRCCGGCFPSETRHDWVDADRAGRARRASRSRRSAVGKKLRDAQPAGPLLAHGGDPVRARRRSSPPTSSAKRATCSCSSPTMDALDELQTPHRREGGDH